MTNFAQEFNETKVPAGFYSPEQRLDQQVDEQQHLDPEGRATSRGQSSPQFGENGAFPSISTPSITPLKLQLEARECSIQAEGVQRYQHHQSRAAEPQFKPRSEHIWIAPGEYPPQRLRRVSARAAAAAAASAARRQLKQAAWKMVMEENPGLHPASWKRKLIWTVERKPVARRVRCRKARILAKKLCQAGV